MTTTLEGSPKSPRMRSIRARTQRLVQRRASLVVVGIAATGLAVSAKHVLPAKYFNDSNFIQQTASKSSLIKADPTFQSTANFYALFGLQRHEVLVALLTMLVYAIAITYVTGSGRLIGARLSTILILYLSIFLCAIYVATFSKEVVVLIAVTIILPMARLRSGMVIVISFMCLYAWYFRQYWLLVAAVTIAGGLVCRKSASIRRQIVVLMISLMLVALAVRIAGGGESLNALREHANYGRAGAADARSLIPAYVSGGTFVAGYVNAFVTFFLLVVPVPLLGLLAPQYVLAALFLIGVTCRTGRALRLVLENFRQFGGQESLQAKRCLLAAYALTIVQSVYVPDYGSALKHFTPVLPLVLFGLLWSDRLQNVAEEGES